MEFLCRHVPTTIIPANPIIPIACVSADEVSDIQFLESLKTQLGYGKTVPDLSNESSECHPVNGNFVLK